MGGAAVHLIGDGKLRCNPDGNLTSDGVWACPRAEESQPLSSSSASGLLHCTYDYMGRRPGKKVYTHSESCRFASWGASTSTSTVLHACDANSNVTDLARTHGVFVARYDYDSCGNTTSRSEDFADINQFRLSTKYTDDETGLYYYGYRYYHPGMGRWLSRDPIGTRGGKNLYAFVANSPIHRIDPRGLQIFPGPSPGGNAPPGSVSAYCCGWPPVVYNPENKCCCKNGTVVSSDFSSQCKLVDRVEIPSGVKRHNVTMPYQIPDAPTQIHVWLEWTGYGYDGTADSNAGNSGRISSGPSGAALQGDDPGSPTDVKLDPCKYDFKKFHKCLSDKATPLNGQPGPLCTTFADDWLVGHCKAASETKGCTTP